MRAFLILVIDDVLLIAGCGCILRGLSLWNMVIFWIVAGLMLIGFGALIAMRKARANATH